MDNETLKEIVKNILIKQKISSIEIKEVNFANKEISFLIKKPNAEEFVKTNKLFKNKGMLPKFKIDNTIVSDSKAYFNFIIESFKLQTKSGKELLKEYHFNLKNNQVEVIVPNQNIASQLENTNFYKNFSKNTGYSVYFNSEVSNNKDNTIPIIELGKINENKKIDLNIKGEILKIEHKFSKDGHYKITNALITDYTSSINCKVISETNKENIFDFKVGDNIKINGKYGYDKYSKDYEVMINEVEKILPIKNIKQDNAKEKRIEFHARTNMSEMSALESAKEYAKRAKEFGHSGITITDLGVAYAFPYAFEEVSNDFKVIFGIEMYMKDEEGKTSNTMVIVKNQEGIKDLYELISLSHLEYFDVYEKKPKIPKNLLEKKKKNLLISSSSTASEGNFGELIKMYLNKENKSKIREKSTFYDYIEIQPVSNYQDLIEKGEITSKEIQEMNKWFVKLGKEIKKPVIAVGDMQYLDEEDNIVREAIMLDNKNNSNISNRKLYFRTTEEMLKEFEFLGPETAKEIVVTNTNKLANQIKQVRPVPKGFYPPKLKDAEKIVKEMTYNKMYELYGENPPLEIIQRIEKELKAITENGFATLYLTAQKLVKKSNDLGYLVGSRGSVGSSVVAYLMGITEVNGLQAHYRCPCCKHTEFPKTKESGIDLPDKNCTECGTPYVKDGHSIPFEIFMGFNGDKVPDIDLNFSGEIQEKIQKYTETIFGTENVYRAGLLSTLAEKNAYNYIKKYLDKNEIELKKAEIQRLAEKCQGVRKTTGQHPSGMIIVPEGHSIYEFSPIQRPANDMKSNFKTTHFDYHTMDKQLVKVDILAQEDPTMLKQLQDLTGININDIPLDDKKVLSLFNSTYALGLTPKEIKNNVGTNGLPEFGTSFAKKTLEEIKPQSFSDLVRISGLSHGTDVWLNNGQELLKNGTAKLNEIICVRDDIMNKLVEIGMDKSTAFEIMEFVRKGKPQIEPEKWQKYKIEMQKQGIPQWYINSCEKIKYMFPKGHATAYVISALKMGWFKVNKPLEFYTAYLNRKINDFNTKKMMIPLEKLEEKRDIMLQEKFLKPQDKQELALYEILIEMKYRGIELENVDLQKSNDKTFKINRETGKILPPLVSINGLNLNNAQKIIKERENGIFKSQRDFEQKTGLDKNSIKSLKNIENFQKIPKNKSNDEKDNEEKIASLF